MCLKNQIVPGLNQRKGHRRWPLMHHMSLVSTLAWMYISNDVLIKNCIVNYEHESQTLDEAICDSSYEKYK